VFVAGDIANAYHPFYGERIRVEHWANALHQGPLAARTMLGHDDVYDRLPYFFSDQYDVGMEYSGHATGADRVVLRGDPASREFIAFWLAEGRVVAGMNVNVWDVADTIRALIASRDPVDERRLTDPDVPLTTLVAGDHAALGEAS
jgi:3-phenylpropionate/trans-cinnamate dioxygenase ferredoxin reductase subunit